VPKKKSALTKDVWTIAQKENTNASAMPLKSVFCKILAVWTGRSLWRVVKMSIAAKEFAIVNTSVRLIFRSVQKRQEFCLASYKKWVLRLGKRRSL